jgi:gliding motility-associated transport system permease protein
MGNTLVIAKKELKGYLGTPSFYIIIAVFLFISGYGFAFSSATYQDSTIQGFLDWGSFFLLFLGPALTMRLFAEEEKLGTLELLLTAPVRDIEVVLGKFLAALGIFSLMLALTLYYPLLLALFGQPDPGPIFSGYVGILLLGAVFLSIGLFSSSLTSNQIVAFVLGSALVLSFWFIGQAGGLTGDKADRIFQMISVSTYFPAFARGVIDSNALIYYLSIMCVFLFLTLRSLESRRWR